MSNEKMLTEIYKLLNVPSGKKLIDVINEKKDFLGISNLALSKILSIDKSTFDRTIKKIEEGDVENIDFFHILKICQFFNISLDEISQVYVASLKPEHIRDLETSRTANFLFKNFDLKGLKEIGIIDNITDINNISSRLSKFFDLESIFDYNEEVGGVLFSRTKRTSQDLMREFWVRSAYIQFQKIDNLNDYEKDKLLALVPKIRPYTRFEEKGFLTVIKALYHIGITVIVQNYLSKTQVRGATFVVKNKPCIVITNLNKNYPAIWFALLHELYHVLFDFEELKTWKYHLTGAGELDTRLFKEDYADYFACETLFPQEKLNFIKHQIASPMLVNDYAEKNKIHPSIIYAFYCYEEKKNGKDVYAFYQKYFGKAEKALTLVKTNPWDKTSIAEEVEKIKLILSDQS
jgi:HTH-type transcriptional regulator / antitoxin HigA